MEKDNLLYMQNRMFLLLLLIEIKKSKYHGWLIAYRQASTQHIHALSIH